jgi:putative spermidine/putrescine transport system substrate-binding protein
VDAYNVKWDVVDMELGDVLRGCQQGLLEKIDQDGAEPSRRLAQGETVMSSAFNGRIYDAIADKRQPFRIVWDGQAWEYDMWAIPKRTERTSSLEAAMAFVKFATDTQRLADQAKYISYGPARQSSLAILNEDIKSHLPTAPANAASALRIDAQWWADHQDVLERRFEHWRARRQFMNWYSR